jgi:hypothetical protein
MTRFIQPSFPAHHAGVARFESAVTAVDVMRHRFNSSTSLSAMLLAAMVSALVVVADQLIDTWAEGHLLAAWVALWLVGFAAAAIFASAARQLSAKSLAALDRWSANIAKNRADAHLWAIAQSDARVMADLNAAITRSER